MGIQGLLPFLQKCSRKVDMTEFSGCTVAVDAYCWLHKGVFSCAEKLARGEDTDQYVNFCMKYISMLVSHNIRVILVFDGCHLPAKAETEKARREKREATKKKACELLRSDKGDEARQLLRRCVDVSHAMAHKLISRARAANVDCIVAPYEADAQLAYLNISGMAHFVITEDSDLLLFGCSKVVFKLDIGGVGLLVEQEMLSVAMKMRPEEFSLDKFRQMCVLSGCDYLPSLPGIGLTKACKFVKLTSQSDISKILHKIGSYLNMPNLTVPEEYKYKFNHALAMFCHQPVFDPQKRKVVPLTPVEDGTDVLLPQPHPPDVALQLAVGNIDPISMKVVDDWNPDIHLKDTIKKKSIWSVEYKKPSVLPPSRPKEPKAVTTFGKKLSMPTDDLFQPSKIKKSDEDELEEMRAAWGMVKKRKLDQLGALEDCHDIIGVDELVEPSPPRNNPFKTPHATPNLRLTPSTTLSRMTSPPQAISKYFGTPNSANQLESKTALSPASPAPLVVSRYFADSTSTEVKNSTISLDNLMVSNSKETPTKPIVIPESPNKCEDKDPVRKNIFAISSPSPNHTGSVIKNVPNSSTVMNKSNNTSIVKSLLSALNNEDDENTYRCSDQPTNVAKTKLSNFKWKPLTPIDKPSSNIADIVTELEEELVLDTPPCSQEMETVAVPKTTTHLEPARQIGLSKNSSPAMQAFLSKFKFQPKSKMKVKK